MINVYKLFTFTEAKRQITQHNIKNLSFDPMRMCVEEYHSLKDIVSLAPMPNFTQIMRMKKSDEELKILQQAQILNLQAIHAFSEYYQKRARQKARNFYGIKSLIL